MLTSDATRVTFTTDTPLEWGEKIPAISRATEDIMKIVKDYCACKFCRSRKPALITLPNGRVIPFNGKAHQKIVSELQSSTDPAVEVLGNLVPEGSRVTARDQDDEYIVLYGPGITPPRVVTTGGRNPTAIVLEDGEKAVWLSANRTGTPVEGEIDRFSASRHGCWKINTRQEIVVVQELDGYTWES